MTNSIVRVIDLVPGRKCEIESLHVDALETETFWSHYICRRRPLLIRSAVKSWPALQKWDEQGYLEGLCGDETAGILRTFNPSVYLPGMAEAGKLSDHLKCMRDASDDHTYSIPGLSVPPKW